jgi:hypothetical protein
MTAARVARVLMSGEGCSAHNGIEEGKIGAAGLEGGERTNLSTKSFSF